MSQNDQTNRSPLVAAAAALSCIGLSILGASASPNVGGPPGPGGGGFPGGGLTPEELSENQEGWREAHNWLEEGREGNNEEGEEANEHAQTEEFRELNPGEKREVAREYNEEFGNAGEGVDGGIELMEEAYRHYINNL